MDWTYIPLPLLCSHARFLPIVWICLGLVLECFLEGLCYVVVAEASETERLRDFAVLLGHWLAGSEEGAKGIKAECALPYHHYQRGAIEWFNCTIQDMGRAALTDSNLPKSFWGFAFQWANYTLNRLPNKGSENLTPFKAFHRYRPTVDHLQIFGCKAFVLTPPEKRKKLDNRAKEATVVGYVDGGEGWMIWIPAEN